VHDCVHRVEVERQVAPRDLNVPVLIDQSRLLHSRVRLVLGFLAGLIAVLLARVLFVIIVVFFTLVVIAFSLLNDAGMFGLGSFSKPAPRLGLRAGSSPYATRCSWP
jgi:hypothetical protein